MKKPEKGVAACEEFFVLVWEAHICTAAMKVFGMSSLKDTPTSHHFPKGCTQLNPKQRWNVLRLAIKEIIDQFVDIKYPTPTVSKDKDHVRAYAKEVVSLGLLLMEFIDAIREGDGDRIIRCWRYFLPLFKCSDRTNYSVEAFNLLFEYEYAFTERMKQHLKWERTINATGRPGRNVPMDLHMEHINKHCKQAMGSLGSNIGEKSVGRIGKSIGELMKVTQQFDSDNNIHEDIGRHPKRTVEMDMNKLLLELHTGSKVFEHVPGRKHTQFKTMQVNMTRKLSSADLKKWMLEQVHKYEMFYI